MCQEFEDDLIFHVSSFHHIKQNILNTNTVEGQITNTFIVTVHGISHRTLLGLIEIPKFSNLNPKYESKSWITMATKSQ